MTAGSAVKIKTRGGYAFHEDERGGADSDTELGNTALGSPAYSISSEGASPLARADAPRSLPGRAPLARLLEVWRDDDAGAGGAYGFAPARLEAADLNSSDGAPLLAGGAYGLARAFVRGLAFPFAAGQRLGRVSFLASFGPWALALCVPVVYLCSAPHGTRSVTAVEGFGPMARAAPPRTLRTASRACRVAPWHRAARPWLRRRGARPCARPTRAATSPPALLTAQPFRLLPPLRCAPAAPRVVCRHVASRHVTVTSRRVTVRVTSRHRCSCSRRRTSPRSATTTRAPPSRTCNGARAAPRSSVDRAHPHSLARRPRPRPAPPMPRHPSIPADLLPGSLDPYAPVNPCNLTTSSSPRRLQSLSGLRLLMPGGRPRRANELAADVRARAARWKADRLFSAPFLCLCLALGAARARACAPRALRLFARAPVCLSVCLSVC
jgi:hypothetical protein